LPLASVPYAPLFRSALLVGVGAYAAVGLGVKGRVPADIVSYGGWLAALIIAAHVTVRMVAPYADPVLLPIVAGDDQRCEPAAVRSEEHTSELQSRSE